MLYKVVSDINIPGIVKLCHSLDVTMHPDHAQYIVNPMSLATIKEKILSKKYCSLDSFLADVKWIQHNSHVYRTPRLYHIADELVKKAEEACQEIENCPECFLKDKVDPYCRFTQPCNELHPIVFARRQGSAIWPGKAIAVSKSDDPAK